MAAKTNRAAAHHILELDKVMELLCAASGCADTREAILTIEPEIEIGEVRRSLQKTDEAYQLVARFGAPSVYGLRNINEGVRRAKAGGVLSMRELLGIAEAYRTIRSFHQYGRHLEGRGELAYLFDSLAPQETLEESIFRAIRSEDEMDDHASSALFDIRRKIRTTESRVRSELESMVHSTQYQKYLQDAIITMRDGRFVLPVKSEYRGEVRGLVHDTSGSGATLFIEPMRIVELNNDVAVLKSNEMDEIHRILEQFSLQIGSVAEELERDFANVIQLDLYFSKARLAFSMNAICPILNDEGRIVLKKARHPLIAKEHVVPIDVELGVNFSTLVVTGPNTGGKTVTLKTIGLLTLMAQCGLMIPAQDNSELAVFAKVLPDIGDEQSIEQSLSTFSAHMTNIISILATCDDNSLVLLDELGAGTDPTEGAALGISILETLREKGAKVAATTHYAELKMYALDTLGVENASCEFNVETLSPTYRLLIGVPGRSNAFAISRRLGLSQEVISRAEGLVTSEKARFEQVVSALDDQRKKLQDQEEKTRATYLEAEKIRMAAKNATRTFDEEREKVLEQARKDALRIVEKVQADAQKMQDEIIETRKKLKDPKLQNQMSTLKSEIGRGMKKLYGEADFVSPQPTATYAPPRPFAVGDKVEVVSFQKNGIIVSLSPGDGRAVVQVGMMKTSVKQSDLRLLQKLTQTQPAQKKIGGNSVPPSKSKAQRAGSREVDVRGMNVEEALMEIDDFIDDSLFSHTSTLTIIHGKGTGVLRNAIGQHLKKNKAVRTYRLGVFGEGESGVTVVEMK